MNFIPVRDFYKGRDSVLSFPDCLLDNTINLYEPIISYTRSFDRPDAFCIVHHALVMYAGWPDIYVYENPLEQNNDYLLIDIRRQRFICKLRRIRKEKFSPRKWLLPVRKAKEYFDKLPDSEKRM